MLPNVVNDKSPVVRVFLAAGAFTPFSARTAAQLGLEGSEELTQLIEAGVILQRRRSPERLYLPVVSRGVLVPGWVTVVPIVLLVVVVAAGATIGLLALVRPDLVDRLIAFRRR